MALKELRMETFLGKTVTHSFNQKNRIRGPNGSGKTSIKEAICFLFTGTDSAGSRNPQHLISKDEEGCKVTVVTDKAEISRSLTRKGNGTLKLTRNGVSQALTQAQMEASVGSVDLFLSAFIPGYFLRLTAEKQHKIISEVSPKVDRVAMIKQLSGIDLTQEEQVRYGVTRRIDLVANSVAADRREYDRQVAVKEGEIKQLDSLKPLPEPKYPSECDQIPYMESLQKAWAEYEAELVSYNNLSARYDRVKIENDLKASKRAALKERLSMLQPIAVPEVLDTVSTASSLRALRKPTPPPPAVGTIVEADHCPTCGQTVGKSHRDHVKERNAQIMAGYERAASEVKRHNDDIDLKLTVMDQERRRSEEAHTAALRENDTISRQTRALEIELAALVDAELPASVPDKPSAPETVFNKALLEQLRQQKQDYAKQMATCEYVQTQLKDAALKKDVIVKEVSNLTAAVERLQQIENAIRQIPQEELKGQMKALEMKTVVITVDEKIEVTKDGILYDYLSTGQQAKADVELCQKLNSLMPKPINMIFLDNADLVDEVDWGEQQMFAAFVDKSVDNVYIEAV